jgi:hypothetical protein
MIARFDTAMPAGNLRMKERDERALNQHTFGGDLSPVLLDLLLQGFFRRESVWVEAAQLLVLLPGQDRVRERLVGLGGQLVLLNR